MYIDYSWMSVNKPRVQLIVIPINEYGKYYPGAVARPEYGSVFRVCLYQSQGSSAAGHWIKIDILQQHWHNAQCQICHLYISFQEYNRVCLEGVVID